MKCIRICLILCLTLFIVACGSKGNTKTINIAVTGSLEVYNYDESFLKGVEMAIEDTNNEYNSIGYKINSEFFDDDYDFEKGQIITNKIAENSEITAVLGSHSFAITEAAAPIFDESNKIMIAVNSMMDKSIMGKDYINIFRNTYGEKDMAESLAEYAYNNGNKKIAVCHSNTEFENNLINAFAIKAETLGLSVLDYTTEIGSERDFMETYDVWRALDIDAVLISRDAIIDAFTLAKHIRKCDANMDIYGDFSFDVDDKLKEYKEYVEGIVLPTLATINYSEKVKLFDERYKEKYDKEPTWWAIHGYDSVRMIVDTSVKINSNDPTLISEEIHKNGYEGVNDQVDFNTDGVIENEKSTYMIVENGVLKEVDANE